MSLNSTLSGLPFVGGFFDDSQENAQNAIAQNQSLWNGLSTPDEQWQNFTPEQYASLGNFDPTKANASLINVDPSDRSSELAALNQMAGLAQTGLGPQDQAAFQQAQNQANQTASSGEQAAEQNAEARGMGGSGLSFALGEQARQNASQNENTAGLQQAASAAQQRALYNNAYMSGLSNLQSQDASTAGANANILNQFNMANTNNANQYGYQNFQNNQGIANQNVAQNNSTTQYNQQGQLGVQQQNYANAVTKLGGQTGSNQAVANTYAAQNAANQSAQNANTALGVNVATGLGALPGLQKNNQNTSGGI